MKRRILNLLVALDRLVYVLVTLGHGTSRETLSGAAYRMELEGQFFGFFRPVIDALFAPIETNHCRRCYEDEK